MSYLKFWSFPDVHVLASHQVRLRDGHVLGYVGSGETSQQRSPQATAHRGFRGWLDCLRGGSRRPCRSHLFVFTQCIITGPAVSLAFHAPWSSLGGCRLAVAAAVTVQPGTVRLRQTECFGSGAESCSPCRPCPVVEGEIRPG